MSVPKSKSKLSSSSPSCEEQCRAAIRVLMDEEQEEEAEAETETETEEETKSEAETRVKVKEAQKKNKETKKKQTSELQTLKVARILHASSSSSVNMMRRRLVAIDGLKLMLVSQVIWLAFCESNRISKQISPTQQTPVDESPRLRFEMVARWERTHPLINDTDQWKPDVIDPSQTLLANSLSFERNHIAVQPTITPDQRAIELTKQEDSNSGKHQNLTNSINWPLIEDHRYTYKSTDLLNSEAKSDGKNQNISRHKINLTPKEQASSTNKQKRAQDSSPSENNVANYNDTSILQCRLEKDLYLSFEQFKHYTCAKCYELMLESLFYRKFVRRFHWLQDYETKQNFTTDETEAIKATFRAQYNYNQWRDCCQKAVDCCIRNSAYLSNKTDAQGNIIDDPTKFDRCPATWDGYKCWPDTPAGTIADGLCPDHIFYLDHKPVCAPRATKQCFANGSWYIRANHEWTDYHNCHGRKIYEIRFLIGSLWHLFSAIVIGPALLILNRVPNRGNGKRVKILSNLLLWLLFSALINAVQKIGIIGGMFHAQRTPDFNNSQSPPQFRTIVAPNQSTYDSKQPLNESQQPRLSVVASDAHSMGSSSLSLEPASVINLGTPNNSASSVDKSGHYANSDLQQYQSPQQQPEQPQQIELQVTKQQTDSQPIHTVGSSQARTNGRSRAEQSAPLVFICWFLELGKRITRQLCYAWMFAGAVYLCSVLHFAPAEPPVLLIRCLMLLTNTFPVVVGLIYVIARTMRERSPLNLIVKVPYYKLMGNQSYVDHLWATQLDCWMLEASSNSIEEIVDFPNLVLVILNSGLFIITLIIMCRIHRPDSNRPDMSLGNYCKAAGTLVILYGAHYALAVYRTYDEECFKGQVIAYVTLFADGFHGIMVSFVFCYKTPEGNRIIKKWWTNLQIQSPIWLCCADRFRARDRMQGSYINSTQCSTTRSARSNHSSKSICDDKDTVIELISGRDNPNQF